MMEHTAILRFRGTEKTGGPKDIHRFGILSQHCAQLTRRTPASSR